VSHKGVSFMDRMVQECGRVNWLKLFMKTGFPAEFDVVRRRQNTLLLCLVFLVAWRVPVFHSCYSRARARCFCPCSQRWYPWAAPGNESWTWGLEVRKKGKGLLRWMDSWGTGLVDPITLQLVPPPVWTWWSYVAKLSLQWLELSDGRRGPRGFLQRRWTGRGSRAGHHVAVSIQVEVNTFLQEREFEGILKWEEWGRGDKNKNKYYYKVVRYHHQLVLQLRSCLYVVADHFWQLLNTREKKKGGADNTSDMSATFSSGTKRVFHKRCMF